MGLHGGRALMIDVPLNWTVWDVIREICDANDCSKDPSHPLYSAAQAERAAMDTSEAGRVPNGSLTGFSPWNVRLVCHDPNTNYATFVHFRFRQTLQQILEIAAEDSKKWFRKHGMQPMEKCLSISNSPHFEMYELIDGRYSYQSRYRPCYSYAKDAKPPEYGLEKMHPKPYAKDGDSTDKHLVKRPFDFHALRIWEHQTLTLMYGDEVFQLILEHCSPGCVCWTDELCGCRIAFIIEHMLHINVKHQGYVMGGKEVVLDYLDESFSHKLWLHNGQMIIFKNFTIFNQIQKNKF
ncbi:hypothetical protein RFI_28844 [Reticulomyxa filosa]|uniref:Uncharacterized protein n=1 Tax=Reticulomyxa filosa TaxID=46433 RepID=X6M507_RETFI|nr:hypothetical protein RFI_28844 [Reticulomyxa filosa]|eukprot:ETO08547.1 hypothetical protein RFI_28844 [Reticulomyxa filosa]